VVLSQLASELHLYTRGINTPLITCFRIKLAIEVCFAIRGGTTEKSCEGLVGPIPMGVTSRLRLVTFSPYVMVPRESP
jgi:hypothetical protein